MPRTPLALQALPPSAAAALCALGENLAVARRRRRVGDAEADSTMENALSMSRLFALDEKQAIKEVRTVARVVHAWKEHFQHEGVSRADIDLYAEQIDRSFLKDQRMEYL